MQESISKDKNKLKIFSSLLIIVLLIMGTSFAIFQNYARQSGTNNLGATNCFSVTFSGVNNAINLANDYPIPDSEGLERSPYTFKVTNNCNQYLSLSIGVETLSISEIPSNLIKGVIVKNGEVPTSVTLLSSGKTMVAQNGGTAYELLTDGLGANASKTYDLRLWFDESMTKEQGASKKYQGKVIVGSSAGVEPLRNLREVILADNEVKAPITTPGAEISAASEALLASTEDDYGTSYYFRGIVKNNYVEFANKCWRIVRVGGDGSVKLILHNDNTAGAANPCSSANNSTSAAFARYSGTTYISKFNTNYNDNAYVGFMYGTAGSSTYAATHANTNKSTILTNLETWYNNNLKTYKSVIDDTVWCTDKTNITDTSYNPFAYGGIAKGLGCGANKTYYGSTQRLVSTSYSAGGTGPSLKCNGELGKITSKVGLITADELAFAGYAFRLENSKTYLQENADDIWWSLSPFVFDGDYASVWRVRGDSGGFDHRSAHITSGVRPSISLNPSTNVTGNGTSENPYKVV